MCAALHGVCLSYARCLLLWLMNKRLCGDLQKIYAGKRPSLISVMPKPRKTGYWSRSMGIFFHFYAPTATTCDYQSSIQPCHQRRRFLFLAPNHRNVCHGFTGGSLAARANLLSTLSSEHHNVLFPRLRKTLHLPVAPHDNQIEFLFSPLSLLPVARLSFLQPHFAFLS